MSDVRTKLAQVARTKLFTTPYSMSAVWAAGTLIDAWPVQRPPGVVRLIRRPAATPEQWTTVRGKLEAALVELAELGAPVALDWGDREALLLVDGAQETLW